MFQKDSWSRPWPQAALCLGFLFAAACGREPAPDYHLGATVKDIMASMVDPSADVVWNSVATVQTGQGTVEREPRTDEDWKTVRHHAIIVSEATNLLVMPGRHVARPHERSDNPEVELHPEEIEELIKNDRQTWINYAAGLNEKMMIAIKATEAKDVKGLFDVGEEIDTACENCHRHYWYPPGADKRPALMKKDR